MPRSAKSYGLIEGESCAFRVCDSESIKKMVDPCDEVISDVARATLYMSDTYGIRLSKKNRQMFQAWDQMGPPDPMEKWRNGTVWATQTIGLISYANDFCRQIRG